ncbi:MFS transporter [Caenispirillum bisanense]|uniref:MFS transporter n=1 Tax=Caenispirillum bisanense TaxID=414052 RepID=UPI0031E020E9
MVAAVAAIGALLLSVAIMVTGNGLQTTLITIRANIEGFDAAHIGLLVSSYYAGFAVGCLTNPYLVARVGHIRTFAALAALAAATALIYPMVVEAWVWWLLRALAGFAFAGLYTVVESWLNDRASNRNRGALFSVYRVVELSASTAGLLLLNAAAPEGFELFSIASLLIALCLVPVAVTRAVAPAPVAAARLRPGRLYRASPLGVIGIFMVALANSAYWGLTPVFVQRLGHGVAEVSLVMAALLVGGAVAQYPIGWLSDRFDRRTVVIAVAALAAVGGAAMAAVAQMGSVPALLTVAVLFGALTMPLYALLIAHTNDFLEPGEFVQASGGLLLVYGIGAVIGPMLASWVMQDRPAWLLFAYTAAVHVLLVLFGLWRSTRRPPPPPEEQGRFTPTPPLTTPQVFELDPRAEAAARDDDAVVPPVAEAPPAEVAGGRGDDGSPQPRP